MSIKIHHGPPGSYKTSGAVMDDFIPAARAGRVVVTNVRGLDSVERVRDALGDDTVPDSFELIHLPTTEHPDAAKNRQLLSRWWHWLPHGAFMLLDEAQMIWPKTWKDGDLRELDYPGGLDAANAANRPFNWQTAFEMHRHYGWDMVLTTPNIDRLRPDVRQCAEGAYKHKNQAIIGLKGFYLEAFHMADDNGKAASDFLILRNRRIKPEVWKLYDSTATGTVRDTIAGLSLLASPRVLFLVGVLAGCLYWFFSGDRPAVLGGPIKSSVPGAAGPGPGVPGPAPGPGGGIIAAMGPAPGGAAPGGPAAGGDGALAAARAADPLDGRRLYIAGRYGPIEDLRYLFVAESEQDTIHLTDRELVQIGAKVDLVTTCFARVAFGALVRTASCVPHSKRKPKLTAEPASRDDVGGAAPPGRPAAP
ncbi:zonular occludens toxin family protein [Methylococcus mesophilus]|uniref:zonular occludens toxin family protein n=1 Tax=Methylococcus mesophilus TaxID=2993564 RepID=UPI00224AE2D2|nr:zonular occludens toxin domain-containing protein [Methylococcus mesophilus]UZR30214.1 hypothetical protein OOT43_06110 [Methylococcus mesophilus]